MPAPFRRPPEIPDSFERSRNENVFERSSARNEKRREPKNGEVILGCDITGRAPGRVWTTAAWLLPLRTGTPAGSPPVSTMGSGLLCRVVLCLLGAAPLDTAVSQTPKYLIAQMGTEKFLQCEQKLSHDAMYWYKQDSKKLLKIMFAYNNKELIHNETVPSRFSPKSPDKARLNLRVSALETGDSAVYLCASSQHSVAESLPPCAQTPWPSQEAAEGAMS